MCPSPLWGRGRTAPPLRGGQLTFGARARQAGGRQRARRRECRILGKHLGFGSFSKSHSWAGYICFVLLREYSSISVTYGDSCNRWYTMARHVPLTMHRTVATVGVALSFRAPAADPFAFVSSSRTHSPLATFTGPARELCAAYACVCARLRVRMSKECLIGCTWEISCWVSPGLVGLR